MFQRDLVGSVHVVVGVSLDLLGLRISCAGVQFRLDAHRQILVGSKIRMSREVIFCCLLVETLEVDWPILLILCQSCSPIGKRRLGVVGCLNLVDTERTSVERDRQGQIGVLDSERLLDIKRLYFRLEIFLFVLSGLLLTIMFFLT